MSWSDELYSGFSNVKPWTFISNDYKNINVEKQLKDPNSTFNYYKSLIKLRNHSPYSDILIYGSYIPYDTYHDEIIGYIREYNNQKVLVLVNLSNQMHEITLDQYQLLLSNQSLDHNTLKPYQACVFLV